MLELSTPSHAADWLRARVRGTLHADSRRIGVGDGFIAWPGAATDGRTHVPSALSQGAAACLVEKTGVEPFGFDHPNIAVYERLKPATGPIAAEFFKRPTEQLDVLAVTGTNGKTSTSWWLAQALSRLARPLPCALVGTLGMGRPPALEFSGLTTPDPVMLQQQFRRFVEQGMQACAIEASSIGIAERRLDGCRIRVAIFTNFTQDHLDYHGSMEAYWQAKAELFHWPQLQSAVINIDDAQGVQLAATLAGRGLDLWTVSCMQPARLRALEIGNGDDGLGFSVREGERQCRLNTGLIGQYNVSNLLGVLAAMRSLGVSLDDAVQACHGLLPVPGRMERLSHPGAPLVAVDYAHTPDALDKALQALRPLASERGGLLWCVFGCGGDRDATKRPLMAAVCEKNADRVVVTRDTPRFDKPEAIISQILLGLSRDDSVQVEADRACAIAQAIAQAAPADVVLIAGKGAEQHQEIAGVKLPFSDQAHARAALNARKAVGA
ncbi:MAG: UDP-N-acetylmuramoyl-L-alanyl-D-glutamate--2,6-diaminopimelate ligase [Burkholderiaceae bacterium]|nr:UDP-N-acetylmuramoyl-L-alanyl-D-glutamate--2,6-diaminopimelate ligase [Burkholderiaceae bacterium]